MIDAVVDLSHHQASVDFAALAGGGILGVIHKATEGTGYTDPTYAPRRAAAKAAGLLWGAYHFLRPNNMEAQAAHFVAVAGAIDLYVADHEVADVSLADLKTFLREVGKLTGKLSAAIAIYSGHVLKEQLGSRADPELAQYPLWLAHYTSGTPTWPNGTWPMGWWLWQYTESGKVPGVKGNVDRNKYDGTPEELKNDWTGGAAPAPGPEPAEVVVRIEAKGPVKVTVLGP